MTMLINSIVNKFVIELNDGRIMYFGNLEKIVDVNKNVWSQAFANCDLSSSLANMKPNAHIPLLKKNKVLNHFFVLLPENIPVIALTLHEM